MAQALCWVINVFGREGVEVVAVQAELPSYTHIEHRYLRILFVEQQHVVRELDSCNVRESLSWCCPTPIYQVTLQNLYLEVNSEMVISSCIIFSGAES